MAEHKYPATLPPARQQAIEDILSRLRHELTQAHVAAAEWERQARQHEADLIAERAAHEATKGELKAMKRTAHDIADERTHLSVELFDAQKQLRHAAGIVKDLECKMQPANEYVAELERELAAELKSRDEWLARHEACRAALTEAERERDELRRALTEAAAGEITQDNGVVQ